MHSYAQALLFGHYEIDVMFKIKHVPYFDDPIVASATNKVVLVEFIKIACASCHLLLGCELIRRDVLEVERRQGATWVMARLKLHS